MKDFRLLMLILLLINNSNSFCQIVELDSTFGRDGIVLMGPDTALSQSSWSVIQTDKKIISVGNLSYDIVLYRTNPDGSPDMTFGTNGMTITYDGNAKICELQNDNKIVVGGRRYLVDNFFIARYLATGIIDSSFGNNGFYLMPRGNSSGVVFIIQPDQKILIYKTESIQSNLVYALIRLYQNGTLDSTYGNNGTAVINFGGITDVPIIQSLIIQPDNKILISGNFNHQLVVARLDIDGRLDWMFGTGGKAKFSFIKPSFYQWGNTMALQSTGKIVIGLCDEAHQYLFLRLNSNGTLDTTFANNGVFNLTIDNTIYFHNELSSIIITPDDKIIGAGYMFPNTTSYVDSGDIELICLTKDGILDSTSLGNGIVKTNVGCLFDKTNNLLLQSDGKVLVSATCGQYFGFVDRYNSFALVRYNADFDVGVLDFSTRKNLFIIYPNPIQSDFTLKYNLSNNENITINLYDFTGRLIKTVLDEDKNIKTYQVKLNTESLSSGMYLVDYQLDDVHVESMRMMKK